MAESLLAGVVQQCLTLRGKSHLYNASRGSGQDVGVLQQLHGHGLFGALLDLLRGNCGRTEVSGGGGHNQGIGRAGGLLHGLEEFERGPDAAQLNARGIGERSGAGDEGDVRAPITGSFGNGVAHFAGGAVGNMPCGVQGFLGGPGADHHMAAGEVAGASQHLAQRTDDRLAGSQAAHAG